MKILFINPPYYRFAGLEYIYIPLGICSLSAITNDAGHETYVYNMDNPPLHSQTFFNYQKRYERYDERDLILLNLQSDPLGVWEELRWVLEQLEPDVVGITSLTSQVPSAEKVAEICKLHNSRIKTIIGGAHAYYNISELLSNKDIDYVFSGEAEEGILVFLNALEIKVHPKP